MTWLINISRNLFITIDQILIFFIKCNYEQNHGIVNRSYMTLRAPQIPCIDTKQSQQRNYRDYFVSNDATPAGDAALKSSSGECRFVCVCH